MSLQRLILSATLLALAAAPFTSRFALAANEVKTPSGLRIIDVKPGTGPTPQAGQTVTVNYTGWLYVDGKKGQIDLSKVDVSMDGIELEDREFIAAIREKRQPNASLAQVLPCMRALGRIEEIIDPRREAHA